MPFCTNCGHSNSDDARFCSNCGAALTPGEGGGPPPPPRAPVAALPPASALLVVRRGPNSGSRFLLDSDVTTAGRHPESDIFLDDVTVSRRHAEFLREGDGFVVRDVE